MEATIFNFTRYTWGIVITELRKIAASGARFRNLNIVILKNKRQIRTFEEHQD